MTDQRDGMEKERRQLLEDGQRVRAERDHLIAQRDASDKMVLDLCRERDALRKKLESRERALRRIAWEPIGPATASHREVLDGVVEIAKAELEKP